MRKTLIIFIIVFAIVFGGLYVYDQNQNEDTKEDNGKVAGVKTDSRNSITEKELIIYALEEQTAFELLQDIAEVEYEDSDFGVFVKAINGLEGDADNYWALFVNDEYSQSAADSTVVNTGDKISWKYEEIKF